MNATACCATLLVGLTAAAPAERPPSAGNAPEIVVYAAASLRDALQELEPTAERAAGVRLVFNFGASSDLARQIEAANKADVFLSADEDWMDHVARAGLVDAGSRRAMLSNRLVVVGAPDSPLAIGSATDLARAPFKRLALANPEAVPAGKYAKAWLDRQGLWAAVGPRVLPGVDVRAALAAVEAGAAEVGIVYATDAVLSKSVRVLYAVPVGQGPPIVYTVAALADRPHLDAARAVVAWLAGPAARPVFERFGFVPLEGR